MEWVKAALREHSRVMTVSTVGVADVQQGIFTDATFTEITSVVVVNRFAFQKAIIIST